ncbi:MAG: Asp-tRNA(Asn)/Glu-tRNA(Gln) amidotransferase subunit GatB [bacterium]|nr:Asp-tRNA(Asn)/Glu-tRNA(Gln) amidotransferase subunit GatB [Candidatus Sumerlaeota bacterium]
MPRYEPVIGFEVHVELCTNTKIFCGCSTRFGAPPNTQVCPVCLGMPGVLPVVNRKAVEFAIRTAIALNCGITKYTTFDRKNYYYPDLPKNYQISQNYASLGTSGWVDIDVNGTVKRVRINNVHLEEDAGKLLHPEIPGANYSLVDLNRAGTPLVEIVSEPDLGTADEALAYMNTLKNLLEYIEVSDCKMQEGRLRFEVNISLRESGAAKLGTKVEIKNLNSMKTALKCIGHETRRQTALLERGEKVFQETRLWDEAASVTRAMRSKEVAHDYRYFPDPDLVEIHITDEWQEQVRAHLPELPDAKRQRFIAEYDLPEYDARLLTASKTVATYYERAAAAHNNPKAISNWMMTEVLRELRERDIEPDDFPLKPEGLAAIVEMIDDARISGKIAKDVFAKAAQSGRDPGEIVNAEGLLQVTDTGEIEKWVDEAIAENPDMVAKVKAGQTKTFQALVGQIMKKSRGKANPALVNELLKSRIP